MAASAAVVVLVEEAAPAAAVAGSASHALARILVLGIPVDTMRCSEIERRIVAHLGSGPGNLLHIATVNPEYLVAADRDPAFRNALLKSDILAPDGVGIVGAARVLERQPVERVTGAQLVDRVLSDPVLTGARVFLLGNPTSIAELQGRFPSRVVGRWGSGTPDPSDDTESISRIRERSANVVLVGYGAPAQVIWIERNRSALEENGVAVAIGVGGALDFAAGTVGRAPRIVQRAGLEWAYRLAMEPWRWRRQLALPVFVWMVLRAWSERNRPKETGSMPYPLRR
ncbi:MAG: WecB/TagA/CpsF family glycosyltransferase [Thermomicrobiales bacterium]|nr:MAG: WecB/TagA/CpsF family glycosyltransferase [Thermomicrobiales bacterium]